MTEEQKKELEERAKTITNLFSYRNGYQGPKEAYIEGAICQDPISREDERKRVIEKATLWLHKNWRKYVSTDRDGMLAFRGWKEEFKQAMEEQV